MSIEPHPNENISVKVGDTAPNFALQDTDGTVYNLWDAAKNGPVVLVFYRGDW